MPYTVISEGAPPAQSGYSVVNEGINAPPTPESLGYTFQIAQALGHQLGLTGRYAIEGVLGIPELFATGTGKLLHYASLGLLPNPDPGAVSRLLSRVGFAEPQGATERIVGDVARAGAGTAAVAKGAQLLTTYAGPAAKVFLNSLSSQPGAQAVAAAGSGAAAGGAREAGMPPWAQFVASLVGGIAAPTAANAGWEIGKGAARLGRSALQPFNVWGTGGREAMAGDAANQFASDPKALNQFFGVDKPLSPGALAIRARNGYGAPTPSQPQPIPTFVPGSNPTVGQATRDIGLLSLEGGLRSQPDAPFKLGDVRNNDARVNALRTISGTPADLEAAIKDRAANANSDYDFAYSNPIESSAKTNRELKPLWGSDAFKAAWTKAERMASNRLMKPEQMNTENPQFMHFVKLALDDIAESGGGNTFERNMSASVGGQGGVRGAFLDVLDQIAPAYGIARGNYAQASGPINRMTTLQDIMEKAQTAQPDVFDNPQLSQAGWKKAVTNNAPELAQTLQPDEMQILSGIGKDLDRAGLQNSVAPVGSPTVRNLTADTALRASIGKDAASGPITQLLSLPLRKLFEYSGSNETVRKMLTDALQDPTLMRRYLQASSQGADPTLGELFLPRQEGILQGSAIGGATAAAGSP